MLFRKVAPARGGGLWIAPVASLTVLAFLVGWWWPWLLAAAAPGTLLTVAFLWFFRDPDRSPRPGRLLASADGKVQAIDRMPDERTRIATYLNLSDVHVIRAPIAGSVVSAEHTPGRHRPAFRKDSELNERVHWHLITELGDIEIVQNTVARWHAGS